MEHKKERLVESIFNRPASKERKVSPFFRPPSLSLAKAKVFAPTENTDSGVKIDKYFSLGLDIGPFSVKWAQLGLVGGKTHVLKTGFLPLKLEGFAENERKAVLVRYLREISVQHHLSGPVSVSFPLEETNLKLLKIPPVSEEELEDAVRWQLEQTLPSQTKYEDLAVDSVFLEALSTERERHVLVVTAPRQKILSLHEQVRQAGLGPVLAIEIDAFAQATALARAGFFEPDKTDLLLYLGIQRASVSVIMRSQLVFSRPLSAHGANLTRLISDSFRISWEEAEQLKQAHGMSGAPPEANHGALSAADRDRASLVAQALTSSMENLFVDVMHSFKSFLYQVSQAQIQKFDRVLLCGSTGRLPGVAAYLEKRFGVPVKEADPLAGIPSLSNQKKLEADLSCRLGVAAGLADRGDDPGKPESP